MNNLHLWHLKRLSCIFHTNSYILTTHNACKEEQVNICAPLKVSLGYLWLYLATYFNLTRHLHRQLLPPNSTYIDSNGAKSNEHLLLKSL